MQKRVSNHAKERCKERFGVSNKRVKEVMMYGYPPVCFEGPFYHYLLSVKNAKGGAVTAKVKGDMIVVYNKRSQRAITTYKVPKKFQPADDYLLPVFKKAKADNAKLRDIGEYLWKYIGGSESNGNRSAEKSK